jgi:hypothetical protein
MEITNCSPTALVAMEMCESLLLTLISKGIMSADDAVEMLSIMAAAKRVEANEEGLPVHLRAAEITEYIQNSIAAADKPSLGVINGDHITGGIGELRAVNGLKRREEQKYVLPEVV